MRPACSSVRSAGRSLARYCTSAAPPARHASTCATRRAVSRVPGVTRIEAAQARRAASLAIAPRLRVSRAQNRRSGRYCPMPGRQRVRRAPARCSPGPRRPRRRCRGRARGSPRGPRRACSRSRDSCRAGAARCRRAARRRGGRACSRRRAWNRACRSRGRIRSRCRAGAGRTPRGSRRPSSSSARRRNSRMLGVTTVLCGTSSSRIAATMSSPANSSPRPEANTGSSTSGTSG